MPVPEDPFTVKLCVQCQRSVKFRKKQRCPKNVAAKTTELGLEMEEPAEITIEIKPIVRAT